MLLQEHINDFCNFSSLNFFLNLILIFFVFCFLTFNVKQDLLFIQSNKIFLKFCNSENYKINKLILIIIQPIKILFVNIL